MRALTIGPEYELVDEAVDKGTVGAVTGVVGIVVVVGVNGVIGVLNGLVVVDVNGE